MQPFKSCTTCKVRMTLRATCLSEEMFVTLFCHARKKLLSFWTASDSVYTAEQISNISAPILQQSVYVCMRPSA